MGQRAMQAKVSKIWRTPDMPAHVHSNQTNLTYPYGASDMPISYEILYKRLFRKRVKRSHNYSKAWHL